MSTHVLLSRCLEYTCNDPLDKKHLFQNTLEMIIDFIINRLTRDNQILVIFRYFDPNV